MAKIVTVYTNKLREFDRECGDLTPVDMSYIRWFKISESLAGHGHQVDMATDEFRWGQKKSSIVMSDNLRRVPLSKVKWNNYDVVKTLFHNGFKTLEEYGGEKHPFIISKLGTVVDRKDTEGVYLRGKIRRDSYSIQEKINKRSKYVTLLTRQAKELWGSCFGSENNILILPGAVDRQIPPPCDDPYPEKNNIRCIFIGNIYCKKSYPEANLVLKKKLNRLGEYLNKHNIKLYLLGPGDIGGLDRRYVTYLGFVPYEKTWDYLYFANAGIVLLPTNFLQNNESSKLYHYLRAGLPTIVESGFPNEGMVKDSQGGFIVRNGDLATMADKIAEAVFKDWDKKYMMRYILDHHTWEKRAKVYDNILKENL